MILDLVSLASATVMLVAAAYLAIDRTRLPLLCLGAVASVSGAVALMTVDALGMPPVLASVIAILVGAALCWALLPLARYLKPMAFAALTLALAALSTLMPTAPEQAVTGLDPVLIGLGLLVGIATPILIRRLDVSYIGIGMQFADHDSRLADVLGVPLRAYQGPLLAVSGGLAGLAGLLLHLSGAAVGRDFGLELSFALLAVMVIGGRGTFWLALIAAVPVLLMPRLGVMLIDGFPDLTLAVSVLGIVLAWIVATVDRRPIRMRSALE